MTIGRRALLGACATAALARTARAAPVVRLGVLRFGTVSWELDVIRRHHLDAEAGVTIEAVELAGSQATQVAMQAGSVDLTAQDWLWVARQRAAGADWTFSPFSNVAGAVVAPAASPVRSIADLKGRRLGIAGSPIDKSWLILRAYAQRTLGLDLDQAVEKRFAPPPLLAQEVASGRLDAVLTFWPFAARAEAAGMRQVLSVEDAVRGLGIQGTVPVVGYVFADSWAARQRPALDGFLAAAAKAQRILAEQDAEWQALRPLTATQTDAELAQLMAYYRRGIPRGFGAPERDAAAALFTVLAETGGEALVGKARTLPAGTFWQAGPS